MPSFTPKRRAGMAAGWCEGDRAWQCEWTYEGKAKGFNQVVFDGISARYQGNIHNCMDKVGRNANMGGTAGVTLLSLF